METSSPLADSGRAPRWNIRWNALLSARLTALLVAGVALAVSGVVVWRGAIQDREAVRARALMDVTDRAAGVQITLDRALSATYALAAMVRPELGGIPNFDQVAAQLMPFYPGAASLQVAPKGVVQYIFPLQGNEKAVGHDLLADPTRNKEAFLARDTGRMTLAGPFELRQGGVGAVGRLPLYFGAGNDPRERFWGFTVVLIRFPEVLKDVRLDQLPQMGYHYRLSRIHPDTGAVQIIATSLPQGADLPEAVSYPLTMPNGTWTLSVAPVRGWWNVEKIVVDGCLGLLFSALLGYLALQMAALRRHRADLAGLVEERTRDLENEVDHHRETAQRLLKVSLAVEQSPSSIMIANLDGNIEYVNQSFLNNTGYTQEEVLGQNPRVLQSGKTPAERYGQMWSEVTQGRVWRGEFINRRKDGSEYVELATIAPIRQADGRITHYVGVKEDITERKRTEEALRIAAIAFETQEGLVVTDREGTIERVNRAFSTMTGYSSDEAMGQNTRILKSGRHDEAFYEGLWAAIREKGAWQGEIWNRRKNGEIFPEWLSITALRDANGEVSHFVGAMIDITQRKEAEDEIKNLAYFDPLTQLPNRRLLLDRLRIAMSASERTGHSVGILFIDLDDFKTLNDTQGHDVGDLLLQQVGRRLTTCVREIDTVARLGGDEFVVMLDHLHGEARQAAAETEGVGKKILATLNQEYLLGSHAYHTSPSIGALVARGNRLSVDELLKRADLAMYQAKGAGRNTLRFFDPDMQAAVETRARLEAHLRTALKEDQIRVYYQPQVDEAGRVTGVEALVRWQHPGRGLIYPDEFIALAEDTGLIFPLGQRVLELACRQLASWQYQPAFAHLAVAVNVSAREFHHGDFVQRVEGVLQATGADPRRLRLELTESLMLRDVEAVIAKMATLKQLGIRFSLDDFGTGYSSLSYLKRLPLDRLKIDKSFVQDILVDANDAAIAGMIIALAGTLGLAVIAEGVESEAQRDFLAQRGCHVFQGYLYSQPIPVLEFEAFVRARSES